MKRLEKNTWKLEKDEYRSFNPQLVYGNVDEFEEIRAKRTEEGIVHQYALRPHGSQKNIPVILIVE